METWSYIGIAAVIFIAYAFLRRLGKGVPILELMLLIAGLQWIIGPLIEYNASSEHWKYYMYVDEATYMGFVVPAFVVFLIVVLAVIKRSNKLHIDLERLKQYSNYGLVIFFIGVFFDFFGDSLPPGLAFLGFILSNFKYVGAIILYYSENKKLITIFYLVIFYLLIVSISRALFHDFILWSMFFYMFWALKYKPSISKIAFTFLIAGLFVVTLQTAKAAFRMQVWNNYSDNKLELFTSLMMDAFLEDESSAEEFDDGVGNNVRLNQGWIISAVLHHVPSSQDYLEGATIKDAVLASVLPRALNPTKTQAGGQENFRKFTGLNISEGTSMGISIVGEAYGNFARVGGIIFMGVWGFFLARIWLFLDKRFKQNIILIAFVPLLFLQVIKAETELVVVLNHLVKSMIVVFLFIWFAKQYLRWNFEK